MSKKNVYLEKDLSIIEAYKDRLKRILADNGYTLRVVCTAPGRSLDKKASKCFEVLYATKDTNTGYLSVEYLHAPGLFRMGCPIQYDEGSELFYESVIGSSRPQEIVERISYWLFGTGNKIKYR